MSLPFAAVLLAGGRSRRMGLDKALLPLPDGRLLWERQLAVLRELKPAELYISGFPRAGFPPDVPVVEDERPGLGPLGGIAAALRKMESPTLVVLAIDLPAMSSVFLRASLVGGSESMKGIIPRMDGSLFEPLAATYPRAALALAEKQLATEDRSLQTFVRTLIAGALAIALPVSSADASLFINWNEPDDLTCLAN